MQVLYAVPYLEGDNDDLPLASNARLMAAKARDLFRNGICIDTATKVQLTNKGQRTLDQLMRLNGLLK